MDKFKISNRDLLELTEKFCELTKHDKTWERLPYQEWRAFDKYLTHFLYSQDFIIAKDNDIVKLEPFNYIDENKGYYETDSQNAFYLKLTDKKNFALYLLESIKKMLLEEDEVTYTTNTTTATNNYITTSTPTTYTTNSWTYNPSKVNIGGVVIDDGGITVNGKKVLTEDDKMTAKDFGMNFDFGPVTDNSIAVCPFGIAAKNPDGGYCYYDPKEKKIMDCTPFTFDTKKFLFKMPVAIAAVTAGDVIMHRGFPMFVKGLEDQDGRIVVIDIAEAEEKYILPTRNMFGFDFVTKVVSFLDMKNTGADAENPFGNMLPLLMMQDGKELDPMMFLMMSGQNGNIFANLPQNPMLMYMLMNGKTNKDLLPFLLMTCKMPV